MSIKYDMESIVPLNESKRRKTTNLESRTTNSNNSGKISINLTNIEDLNRDLDAKDSRLNFAFNSVKKRKLDQIENLNTSKIPRPENNYVFNHEKYGNFESKIPKQKV